MNLFHILPPLAATACCALLCFCCIWCLKSKGRKPLPWPWLPIVLAVVGIPTTLWSFQNNFVTTVLGVAILPFSPDDLAPRPWKLASLPEFFSCAVNCHIGVSRTNGLGHVLTRLVCLGLSILVPVAISLYQRKQNKNK